MLFATLLFAAVLMSKSPSPTYRGAARGLSVAGLLVIVAGVLA
ncbi:hypothetical protein [Nocardia sp. NPDC024068]